MSRWCVQRSNPNIAFTPNINAIIALNSARVTGVSYNDCILPHCPLLKLLQNLFCTLNWERGAYIIKTQPLVFPR